MEPIDLSAILPRLRQTPSVERVEVTLKAGRSLTLGVGESLIFLPNKERIPPFRNCGHFLQKLWKRVQPVRITKGH